METELQIWKSRAEAHEKNYLQMLTRIDDVIAERDEALQLLRDIRADWGGVVADDGCDCSDCEFLRPIDALLNKYTTNQND